MTTLADGAVAYIQGSGKNPYELKNTGGVFSCSCPAWRNQSFSIDRRSCKHLRKLLGNAHEDARLGTASTPTGLDSNAAKRKLVKGKTIGESLGIDENAILERAKSQGRKLRPDEKAQLNGPPVLLAHKYENDFDPTGWWYSEKLDGVRCFWDGQNLLSRQGNVFHAPQWFLDTLPKFALDGELWMGRQQFKQTISVVKRLDGGMHWKNVKYMVFDAPQLELPFEERVQYLKDNIGTSEFVELHAHSKVESKKHLLDLLKQVASEGAEGLMIREPGSMYDVGRSRTLLKVKQFHDGEAVVTGYTNGAGRHKGVVGALEVRMSNGKEFNLGTGLSDEERRNPPSIGSTVTFTYAELTEDGIPRFASYLCVRDYE